MAPVRTIVLSLRPAAASARAVSTIVSVPCVTTIARSAASRQRSTIAARPAASMSRLSIIMAVSIDRSSLARPSRNISWTCVSRKNSRPVSSSYSLSNVPPVTSIRICILELRGEEIILDCRLAIGDYTDRRLPIDDWGLYLRGSVCDAIANRKSVQSSVDNHQSPMSPVSSAACGPEQIVRGRQDDAPQAFGVLRRQVIQERAHG